MTAAMLTAGCWSPGVWSAETDSAGPVNGHKPVLMDEVMTALQPHPGGVYVDCTYGRGGHTLALLRRVGPDGRVIAIDRDPEAAAAGKRLAARDKRVVVFHGSFAQLGKVVREQDAAGKVDGILFDLGLSSPQVDAAERGFSFRLDGPLDMRMNPGQGQSAADWLNRARPEEIAEVLKEYGEERYARRIARAIVQARPVMRTVELARIISGASPTRERDKHAATRSFQAIRIFVNRELEEIQAALGQVIDALAVGGRLAVISFHSLEDRLVKRFMRSQSRGDEYPLDLPVPQSALRPRLKLIGKVVRPSRTEVENNPRARSAVLRVAEKLA